MTSGFKSFAAERRIAGAVIAAVVLLAACESKLPTSAQIEKADGASATKSFVDAGLVSGGKVRYTIDGKAATEAEAKKLSAGQLVSVEVVTVNDSSEVRLSTAATAGRTDGSPARAAGLLGDKTFDGLLLVDGKIVEASMLGTIKKESIESVEILKGAAAAAKYDDPRAANGVIQITLKKP